MTDKAVHENPPDEWLGLRVLDHVTKLNKDSPETAKEIMELLRDRLKERKEEDRKLQDHKARVEWAWYLFRIFTSILAFAALIVYAWVAFRFIENHAFTQASVTMGASAASVVAIFVTGRATATRPNGGNKDKKSNDDAG